MSFADDANRLRAAREMVRLSGSVETMRKSFPAILEQIRPVLAKQGANQKTIDELMVRFSARLETEVGSYADQLASVYARELSEEDLKNLAEFYKSPTGQRWSAKQPAIISEVKTIGTGLGEQIAREVLTQYVKEKAAAGKL